MACDPSLTTREEMLKYVNDPENGLTKTQKDDYLIVAATMYPMHLMQKSDSNIGKTEFKNSLSFVIKFQPVQSAGNDFLIEAAGTYDNYKVMIEKLNFSPEAFFTLKTSTGLEFKPVLATLENAFESSASKKLFLTFALSNQEINSIEGKKLTVVFDNLFEGKDKFDFEFDTGFSLLLLAKDVV
jgi:hypothetical protein